MKQAERIAEKDEQAKQLVEKDKLLNIDVIEKLRNQKIQ